MKTYGHKIEFDIHIEHKVPDLVTGYVPSGQGMDLPTTWSWMTLVNLFVIFVYALSFSNI